MESWFLGNESRKKSAENDDELPNSKLYDCAEPNQNEMVPKVPIKTSKDNRESDGATLPRGFRCTLFRKRTLKMKSLSHKRSVTICPMESPRTNPTMNLTSNPSAWKHATSENSNIVSLISKQRLKATKMVTVEIKFVLLVPKDAETPKHCLHRT